MMLNGGSLYGTGYGPEDDRFLPCYNGDVKGELKMNTESNGSSGYRNLALILLNKNYWIGHFLIVVVIGVVGLIYLGRVTYTGAPPNADFTSSAGETVISNQLVRRGEEVFHLRGLMSYGSFWGDGAERGPDFTADALHRIVVAMQSFYENEVKDRWSVYEKHWATQEDPRLPG